MQNVKAGPDGYAKWHGPYPMVVGLLHVQPVIAPLLAPYPPLEIASDVYLVYPERRLLATRSIAVVGWLIRLGLLHPGQPNGKADQQTAEQPLLDLLGSSALFELATYPATCQRVYDIEHHPQDH